jgi:hypothetical protein
MEVKKMILEELLDLFPAIIDDYYEFTIVKLQDEWAVFYANEDESLFYNSDEDLHEALIQIHNELKIAKYI